MDISSEDSLRLNVLLASATVVRIDEGAMLVRGLIEGGNETTIRLNPNCRPEQYVRKVRELLSSVVLGSPGGYPVFLKRWSRMGQTIGARLSDLLLLGEPEAVVAVSGSPDLTDTLAERAWWALPDSDNARRMLQRKNIVQGQMGKVLAEFLVEFLPFESEPKAIVETVRLLLQPNLISPETRMEIWQRGRKKGVFRIGFLLSSPDHLPEPLAHHEKYFQTKQQMKALLEAENALATFLLKILSGTGQTYLNTCIEIMKRPSNQDAVVALMEALDQYFRPIKELTQTFDDIEQLEQEVDRLLQDGASNTSGSKGLKALPLTDPDIARWVRSMLVLAHVGEPLVRPVFAHTDAIGSVMRKKLEPVLKPVERHLRNLTS